MPVRSRAELVESQINESLINLAFAGTDGFRLLCPYDVAALDAGVIHEARCSHPGIVDDHGHHPSDAYRGSTDVLGPFAAPLPAPALSARSLGFDGSTLHDARAFVAEHAREAGLGARRVEDLVLAVGELAANSVRHGGGTGIVRVWHDDDAIVCDVKDRGYIGDPLVGRRMPDPAQLGGRGIWIANQLADLVQIRSSASGTVARALMRLP